MAPAPATPESTTLAALFALADRENPALATERKEIDIATAAIWEAQLYPNPTLVGTVEDLVVGSGFSSSTRRVGVRVPIVVGGRLKAGARAAEADRDVAALRYLWRRREVFLEIRKAYVALLGARRARQAAEESRALAASLVDTAKTRHTASVAPESEVLKAQVDLGKAEGELAAADRDIEAAGRSLRTAVGSQAIDPTTLPGSLVAGFVVPAWASVRARVVAEHPLVLLARREVEASQLHVAAAVAERTSDIELEASAGQNPEGDGVVGLSVGIPLPINSRNEGRIAGAEARHAQSMARVGAEAREAERRASDAYKALARSQEQTSRYAEVVLPTAEKALEQSRFGFEKGKFTYLDVLDAQRTLAEAKTAYAAALSELNQAAAELESFAGVALEPRRTGP